MIGKTISPAMMAVSLMRYVDAVRWIAENEDDDEIDVDEVVRRATVLLVSEQYAVDARVVASDVVRFRLAGSDTEPPTKG